MLNTLHTMRRMQGKINVKIESPENLLKINIFVLVLKYLLITILRNSKSKYFLCQLFRYLIRILIR